MKNSLNNIEHPHVAPMSQILWDAIKEQVAKDSKLLIEDIKNSVKNADIEW